MSRSTLRRTPAFSFVLALAACGAGDPAVPAVEGPLAAHARRVAEEAGVPRDLLLAIGRVEQGLELPRRRVVDDDDHVPVAGILELRRGRLDTLALGAALMAVPERALREDTDLGTEAGARVLARLGAETGARAGDLASWRAAVVRLSGLAEGRFLDEYVAEVFGALRAGGAWPAREGEVVVVEAHPEIPAALAVPSEGVLRQEAETPEFPGAMWIPTSCSGKCNTTRSADVDVIVLHSTEGGWAGSVATLQNDPGKSVHYMIDKDGARVAQFIPEAYTGWHTGNSCWNGKSIGIEHVGFAADPNGFAPEVYRKTVELIQSIRKRHVVPLDRQHIVGHYQIPDGGRIAQCSAACADHLSDCSKSPDYGGANNHRDPGLYFQWCQLMDTLGGACECEDAWSHWNCTTDKTMAVRCANGRVELQTCASCEVRPVGEDDACTPPPDMATAAPPDLGVAPPDAGGALPIARPSLVPPGGHSFAARGCAVGGARAGTPPWWAIAALALGLAARIRRRRG